MSTAGFLHLFRGNPGAVGMDTTDGSVMALRFDSADERHLQWRVLGDAHLAGTQSIGVYPYHQGSVAWGCIDLDEGESSSWSYAIDLCQVLHEVGVTAFPERSRSKGYHVWVFACDWTPARTMRRLLLGACETVGAPTKECNPKQEWLEPGQLGNFVRLPYFGGSIITPKRQVVVDLMGEPLSLPMFLLLAEESAVGPIDVTVAARRLWEPPAPPPGRREVHHQAPWEQRLIPLAWKQLHEGPKAGSDRSTYLTALAYACAESGLDHDEIKAAVRAADEWHCHKYCDRPDADTRYDDLAVRAEAAYA
jgi:hypothetical protein